MNKNQNASSSGKTPTLEHDEAMQAVLVRDRSGNLWAQHDEPSPTMFDRKRVLRTTHPIADASAIAPQYMNLLSGAALLYQVNMHAGELIQAHAANLEDAGQNELADTFLEMAANLNATRRIAIEGLDKISG